MAVRIRLSRRGSKKRPFYRVVVADGRMPRDGRFIEIIGRYDPQTEPSFIEIDKEKALSWLKQGAKPSRTVEKLLLISGIIDEREPKYKGPGPRRRKQGPKITPPKAKREGEETPPTPPPAAEKAKEVTKEPVEGEVREPAEKKVEKKVEKPAEEKTEAKEVEKTKKESKAKEPEGKEEPKESPKETASAVAKGGAEEDKVTQPEAEKGNFESGQK